MSDGTATEPKDPVWDTTMSPEDDDDLTGRVVIVGGGGAPDDAMGNGRATALLFARRGASVAIVDRDGESAKTTAHMVESAGGTGAWFAADVTDADACSEVVDATLERFGRLDALNNNVGVGSELASVVDADLDRFDKVMAINVRSVVAMSRAAIPAMLQSPALDDRRGGGSVVNVSSISALRPRGLTAYSTSKGAVIALTQAMAVDHAADGIRVNCVTPGPVYSARMAARGMTPEQRDARRRASLLGQEGTPWDVANAVVFLASARAKWITGQSLVVDGGATLRGPDR
ncbi:MAG: SDR family oxidoreductase [Actinomycetota bacterium]